MLMSSFSPAVYCDAPPPAPEHGEIRREDPEPDGLCPLTHPYALKANPKYCCKKAITRSQADKSDCDGLETWSVDSVHSLG